MKHGHYINEIPFWHDHECDWFDNHKHETSPVFFGEEVLVALADALPITEEIEIQDDRAITEEGE